MDGPALYDTTLRDGLQGHGMSMTVDEKLDVARLLDELGIGFIEGGWPGAIPRDTEFFRRAADDLVLRNALLAAFGATRRPDCAAGRDPQVTALLAAGTPVVTIVAKSDRRHVERALRTSTAENLAMVADTVALLVAEGRRVFVDAEHYFDGLGFDPAYALSVVRAAGEAGAEAVVLCDTNGGTLPDGIREGVTAAAERTGVPLGIHCHDDGGCAVANSLAAVEAGVFQVQGTANGYGERCGNADLFQVAANLTLKMDRPVLSPDGLARIAETARAVADVTEVPLAPAAPYVGPAAFAHKAGLHTSALRIDPDLYQHIDPGVVGNRSGTLISDMAGRASVELKAAELGHRIPARSPVPGRVVERVKALEADGYSFESADASFELLLVEELTPDAPRPFEAGPWGVTIRHCSSATRGQAIVEITVGTATRTATGTGHDAIAALDDGLHQVLADGHAQLHGKRVLDHVTSTVRTADGRSVSRALLTWGDADEGRTTVGVGPNPVAAGWAALVDVYRHALLDPGAASAATDPSRLENAMTTPMRGHAPTGGPR